MFTFQEIEVIAQEAINKYTKDVEFELVAKTAKGHPEWELRLCAGKLAGAGTFGQNLMDLLEKREEELNEGTE